MADMDIERFITSCFRECVEDNAAAVAENSAQAGKRAVKLLKQKNRQRTGAYKKGWKATIETDETGTACTVHNRVYQLTHLLENGHKVKNQTGKVYGDVPGDGVIREVADQVAMEFAQMGGDGD